MKTLSLLLLFSVLYQFASAQEKRQFRRFKGDLSFGYPLPLDSKRNGGFLFVTEPKLGVRDDLYLGLRMEVSILAKFKGTFVGGNADVRDAKALASYLATADYYFNKNFALRPFAGAGAGIFTVSDDNGNTVGDDLSNTWKFGGMLRGGVEIKHFRVGVEFNLLPSSTINNFIYDNNGTMVLQPSKVVNTYFALKLGVCFGGGPRG